MGPLPLHIEPLSRETAEQVAALEQLCFTDPWSRETILAELVHPLSVFYVALSGEQVAGYAGMYRIVDEGHINNVAVAPDFRRRGVASALLDTLLAYAGDHGLALLTLEVRASNRGAIALYESFGFDRVGVRPGYYHNPDENALLLTKVLESPRPQGADRGDGIM